MHSVRGIRKRDFSSQSASDGRLKPHGRQDRQGIITVYLFICCLQIRFLL